MWRQGNKVSINVYDDDRPVCQCHSEEDARAIVHAINSLASKNKEINECHTCQRHKELVKEVESLRKELLVLNEILQTPNVRKDLATT